MKKLLLIAAVGLAGWGVFAQITGPTVFPNYVITGISPNAKWAVSCDENYNQFAVIDIENGTSNWYLEDDMMSAGLGHCVSNTGIVVASSLGYENPDQPFYWENNTWYPLPLSEGDYGAFPQAITTDGSRIVGNVLKRAMSIEDGDVMTVPVVWERNAQGTYDMYQVLPHPVKDWTGRTPQYILVDDCSADGKVLAGDIVDYSGFVNEPIVFKQGEDGEWTYELVHPELINPDKVEFPELPAEPKEVNPQDYMTQEEYEAYQAAKDEYNMAFEPEPTDFMTDEELEAYYAALAAYEQDWENNPYPNPSDFMTDEEYQQYLDAEDAYWSRPYPQPVDYMTEEEAAAYTAACETYQVAFEEWQEKFQAFDEIMQQVLSNPDVASFSMNSARISPNGQYYIMTGEVAYEDPNSWIGYSVEDVPYLFNLGTGDFSALKEGEKNIYATMVTDEGWVLGATPADNYSRNGVLAKGENAPFETIANVVKDTDPELYAWIEENMKHEVTTIDYVYDETTQDYTEVVTTEEQLLLGTPVASEGINWIASWVFNNWDDTGASFYSYMFPIKGGLNSIDGPEMKSENLRVFSMGKGRIGIIGNASSISVYDLDGSCVYKSQRPGSIVSTGLQSGAYIVNAIGADGKAVTLKTVF